MPAARQFGDPGPPAAKRRTVERDGMAAEALTNVRQREPDALEQTDIACDERPIEPVRPGDEPQRRFEIGMLSAWKANRRFDHPIGDSPRVDAAMPDPHGDASLVRSVGLLRDIGKCAQCGPRLLFHPGKRNTGRGRRFDARSPMRVRARRHPRPGRRPAGSASFLERMQPPLVDA